MSKNIIKNTAIYLGVIFLPIVLYGFLIGRFNIYEIQLIFPIPTFIILALIIIYFLKTNLNKKELNRVFLLIFFILSIAIISWIVGFILLKCSYTSSYIEIRRGYLIEQSIEEMTCNSGILGSILISGLIVDFVFLIFNILLSKIIFHIRKKS